MKITLLVVGKTTTGYIKPGLDDYVRRLSHYATFDIHYVQDVKATRTQIEETQRNDEGKKILAQLDKSDHVVLLDERGQEMTSMQFSTYVQKRLSSGVRRVVFVVGGPYGFSRDVYARANDKLSLSQMTFSHEMVRLFFVEQLYRAFTILNHEPYHHQ